MSEEQHEFKKKHFGRPTWCSFCEKFIWGLGKQGYACIKCDYPCHPKCQLACLVKTACPGTRQGGAPPEGGPEREQPNVKSETVEQPNESNVLYKYSGGSKQVVPGDLDRYYNICQEIGKGAFSVVKKVIHKQENKEYAMKILTKSKQDLSRLAIEMEILQSVKHPNVIELKEIYEKDDTVYVITELVTGGELFERIVNKGKYTERDAANVIRKLLSALDYLHSKGIVHRDLKPENLLLKSVDDDVEIKVADFGLSKIVGPDAMMQSACGTPAYVAPEILSSQPYTKAVDLWSVGVITYILLCGFPPFYHQHIPVLFKAILKADFSYPEEYWSNISDDAIDFIDNLLIADPHLRMTAKMALSHRWIVNEKSDNVLNVPNKLQMYHSEYKQNSQFFGPTST